MKNQTTTQTTAQELIANMQTRRNRDTARRASAPIRHLVATSANAVTTVASVIDKSLQMADRSLDIELLKLNMEEANLIAELLATDTKGVA